ncbi:MAG: diadenylate cyclase CdaA [Anaerovoracaceae bacterium]
MAEFFKTAFSGMGVNDVVDIALTTFIIYEILNFMHETRAHQLFKGLLIFIAAYFVADYFNLHTITWIFREVFTFGIFALVVVFQPELRRGLEVIGRMKLTDVNVGHVDEVVARKVINEITEAVMNFSRTRTGALIVFERNTPLQDIAETGTILEADITSQLLGNIFYVGSPLHDGAVIIRKAKIYAAGCVLPLTHNNGLSKSLGTRHRAGIGITENSDCVTIIVSEETGIISVAQSGRIRRNYTESSISTLLESLYLEPVRKKHKKSLRHHMHDEDEKADADNETMDFMDGMDEEDMNTAGPDETEVRKDAE